MEDKQQIVGNAFTMSILGRDYKLREHRKRIKSGKDYERLLSSQESPHSVKNSLVPTISKHCRRHAPATSEAGMQHAFE